MLKADEIEYSIVIPVYNEEESLKPLFEEILKAMTPLNKPYEIIFVNDASSDTSLEILKDFQSQLPEVLKIIDLNQRVGQTIALRKGFENTKGQTVISMDGDLQNDPADIPKLINKMEDGFTCVCGWRRSREDKFFKKRLSKAANFLQRRFTGLKIHDISCTLRAYKRECIKSIDLDWEGQHRFIPLSLSLKGYTIGEIESNHRKRKFGTTKYSHRRIFRVVKDFFKILNSQGKK